MAVERDYLLRLLQAFAQALAEAISLRQQGKILEALFLLDDKILGQKGTCEIIELSIDQFVERIDFMENFDVQLWALVAEALHEKSTLLELQGKEDFALTCKIKALHLALEVLLSDPETYRQGVRAVVDLAQTSARLDALPSSTLALLREYRGLAN